MPADKPTELSRIKLKTWTRQPVPMISEHSAHSTPQPFGIRTWLWRYTCLLLLISMLWHRQAIFESKGDKLSSFIYINMYIHIYTIKFIPPLFWIYIFLSKVYIFKALILESPVAFFKSPCLVRNDRCFTYSTYLDTRCFFSPVFLLNVISLLLSRLYYEALLISNCKLVSVSCGMLSELFYYKVKYFSIKWVPLFIEAFLDIHLFSCGSLHFIYMYIYWESFSMKAEWYNSVGLLLVTLICIWHKINQTKNSFTFFVRY